MIPPLARRFVAGESDAGVLERARRNDERGVGTICNRLGEHYEDRERAEADAVAYVDLIDEIAATDLRACVSVKPSQLGLGVSEEAFRENLGRVVERGAEAGVFVWIDMEQHTTVDATLSAFEHHARERGGGVGVCLQSNLRRTAADLERLADCPGKVRLVKGAYAPPADVAYRDAERVNERYRADLRYVFEHYDGGVAVGSHDPEMLALARDLGEEFGTDYEVQMLMGVREDALFDLADEVPAWQYAPYGEAWLSYFYRRVMERKENALFALRALVGR